MAAPRMSHCGRWLAWVAWDHPHMPWDASELWVGAPGHRGCPRRPGARRGRQLAGGQDTSVGQPLWCRDGGLVFVWDEAGWWQPWRWEPDDRPRRLCTEPAEFHGPDWVLGQSTMVEVGPGDLVCRYRRYGTDRIGRLDARSGRLTTWAQPCVTVTSMCQHADGVAWIGASATIRSRCGGGSPPGQVPERPDRIPVGGRSAANPADVSVAEHRAVTGRTGAPIHALFYGPRLRGFQGPDGARPPLVVFCHSGPTGAADAGFDPVIQLFTSRGFAVAAVDYSGSTGYGRPYRAGSRGAWGIRDVDDCVDAAPSGGRGRTGRPAAHERAGNQRRGFTALGALIRSDAFAAGACWYPVTDLLALSATTHDFEASYNERLVGPLPGAEDRYTERSPLHRVAEMTGAVLLLQGEDDPVVPPEQARSMAEALQARGVRCELRFFAGEAHGFRKAETLVAAFEAELAFYREVLLGAPGGAA